ncbi:hypothetical protein OC610_12550, partial [Pseudomonas sp. SAICEU22]
CERIPRFSLSLSPALAPSICPGDQNPPSVGTVRSDSRTEIACPLINEPSFMLDEGGAMKKSLFFFGAGLLVVCQQVAAQWVQGDTTPSSIEDGNATVADLRSRYANTAPNCGTDNSPALLCSGVILRVTSRGVGFDIWDPSDRSVQRNVISFSYLRADAKFKVLAWAGQTKNGYIIYPKLTSPAGKLLTEALCSFPMDAWDWHRGAPCQTLTEMTKDGNGNVVAIIPHVRSSPCQLQNVLNSDAWVQHWRASTSSNPYLDQCGFMVDSGTPGSATYFYESLKAKQKINGFNEWNELQLRAWPRGTPNTLPIQAFFYTDTPGLVDARSNQKDFYKKTGGIVVPIIKLTLPASPTEDAKFEFSNLDQEVTAGAGTLPGYSDPPWIFSPMKELAVKNGFRISGKSQPGATVEVCLQGGGYCFNKAVADGLGYWYIDGAQLSPGTYTYTAKQTYNGQVSGWSSHRTVTVK